MDVLVRRKIEGGRRRDSYDEVGEGRGFPLGGLLLLLLFCRPLYTILSFARAFALYRIPHMLRCIAALWCQLGTFGRDFVCVC